MIRDITIGQYFPGKSAIHKMDPRIKILLSILYIVMLFVADNMWGLLLGVLFGFAAYLISRIPLSMIWKSMKPVVPIVIFVAMMLMGVISFARMEIQNQPDIEFPIVVVSITQPGAAPTEIETQITQRIEGAVRTISGVSSISSTASEGNSQTMVEFQLGEDINAAVAG